MLSSRLMSLGRQLLNTNPFQSNYKKYSFIHSDRNLQEKTNLTFVHNISFPDISPIQAIRNSAFAAKKKKSIEFVKQPVVNESICKDVIASVNNKLATNTEGRLFAVVQLCGKQFKVTAGDILVIEGFWPPTIGDKLKLEKVNEWFGAIIYNNYNEFCYDNRSC